MKLLFRHRMFLGIAAIEVITMGALVLALHQMILSEQSDQVRRRATTVVNIVSTMVHGAADARDIKRIQWLLDEVSSSPDIAYLQARIDGNLVAYSGILKQGAHDFKRVDHDLADVTDGIFDAEKKLTDSKGKGVSVEVGIDVEKFKAPVDTTLVRASAIAMLAVLMSSGMIGLLGAYLTRQINRLREAADKVANGDFGARVEVVGNDELAVTAVAFNAMADHVCEVVSSQQKAIDERTEELKLQKERAELLSMTDELTGLMNRRAVLNSARIQLAQARRSGMPLAICMLDIDHFKRVNDTYGHPAGDTVIRSFANLIRENTREADIIGRVGGEEFLLVLALVSPQDASTALERIRRAVESTTIVHEGVEIRCTTSCGGAVFVEGDASLEALVARADACLYRAKNEGRNRVVI